MRVSDGVVVDVARSAIARRVDSAGHVVEDEPADEDDLPLTPPKPRSEDVVEPAVHVGDHADAEDDEATDGPDAKKDQ